MFPTAITNSVKSTIRIGNVVYDYGANACQITDIVLTDGNKASKASLDDIRSIYIKYDYNQPIEFKINEVFFRKSDAVTYRECYEAAWDAFKTQGYETRRSYKISKRKTQVTLRLLPYSNTIHSTIKGIKSVIKSTYNGKLPYAFELVVDKETDFEESRFHFGKVDFRFYFEDQVPLVIPFPHKINPSNIRQLLRECFFTYIKSFKTEMKYDYKPGIKYYL